MSQKALKRKIRRGTEDSDTDFKLPSYYTKKDTNLSDDGMKTRKNQNNGNGSNNESDSDDNVALKNFIIAHSEDTRRSDSPTTKSRSATPKTTPNKSKDAEDEFLVEKENGSSENGTTLENGTEEEVKSTEMEPLLLDVEDPELMFPEEESGSDLDLSDKGSPVFSRSITRRSHTRNIPTPKTPKSMNENGSETEVLVSDMNPIVAVERITEAVAHVVEAEPIAHAQDSECAERAQNDAEVGNLKCVVETNEDAKMEDGDGPQQESQVFVDVDLASSVCDTDANLTVDSCASASETNTSLLANVTGDDETRNIDFSCKDPSILDESSESRSRSRLSVSSRRSIRPIADDVYRRKAFHNAKEGENRSSLERMSVKRKQRSTTPDGPKRYKLEPDPEKSPGFLAYLSSPIYSLRNRFVRTQLPSSTPILKGFKPNPNPLLTGSKEEEETSPSADGNAEAEIVDETHVIPAKKWCVMM